MKTFRPENKAVLSLVSFLALFVTVISRSRDNRRSTNVLLVVGCAGVYCFRSANGSLLLPVLYGTAELSKGISEARVVYAMMCIMLIDTVILCFQKTVDGSHAKSSDRKKVLQTRSTLDKLFHGIQNIWILLMFLLMRPHNICLVAMISAQELCLRIYLWKMCDSFTTTSISLLYLWMGQAAFYYQVSINKFVLIIFCSRKNLMKLFINNNYFQCQCKEVVTPFLQTGVDTCNRKRLLLNYPD